MKSEIQALAKQALSDITAIRRHLHAHPELSFEEEKTGAFIAECLEETGIETIRNVAGFGVIGVIQGGLPGRTIALRADIDALPILEANQVEYCSQNPGVMHACGHDVHSASLLGTARILHALKERLPGKIMLLFQPAEEKLPGGASLVIAEGWMEEPEIVIGQHVHPPLRAGKVGLRAGKYMASTDELYVKITGKGGHGALPQDCIDPIAVAANLILSLQQVVSRRADPTIPTVLTFGKIWSEGGATNIIPDVVRLEGTFRTMDEAWRLKAHEIILQYAEQISKAAGASCEFVIEKGYPFLVNEPALSREVFSYLEEYLGAEQVEELPIRMTAEDFAYYSQIKPACFYRLGTGNPERGISSPLHSNTFDIDESALETGMGAMAWIAYKALTNS